MQDMGDRMQELGCRMDRHRTLDVGCRQWDVGYGMWAVRGSI